MVEEESIAAEGFGYSATDMVFNYLLTSPEHAIASLEALSQQYLPQSLLSEGLLLNIGFQGSSVTESLFIH